MEAGDIIYRFEINKNADQKHFTKHSLYYTYRKKIKQNFHLIFINHPSPVASLKVFLTQLTIFTLTALHISISRIIWFWVGCIGAV